MQNDVLAEALGIVRKQAASDSLRRFQKEASSRWAAMDKEAGWLKNFLVGLGVAATTVGAVAGFAQMDAAAKQRYEQQVQAEIQNKTQQMKQHIDQLTAQHQGDTQKVEAAIRQEIQNTERSIKISEEELAKNSASLDGQFHAKIVAIARERLGLLEDTLRKMESARLTK